MTYICYHHKIIPENYFALTAAGQLVYNGRCVESPRSPHLELVECTPRSSARWEMKNEGPVWGSLRLHQNTAGGSKKEWCIAQVRPIWLGGVTVLCPTYDREVAGSTPGRVTIKRLLLRWVTVCRQVNYLGI